jgi:hypothetical protein
MAKFKVSKYGQWEYPGQPTAVPTEDGRITMQGVPYPVMGYVPGQPPIIMQPGGNYQFPGKMVYEIPMAYGGDISIPDLSRPAWLDKYQEGTQVKANLPGMTTVDQDTADYGVGPTVQKDRAIKERKMIEELKASYLPPGSITPAMGPVERFLMPSFAAEILSSQMQPKVEPTEIPPHLLGHSSPYYGNFRNPTPNKFLYPKQKGWVMGDMKPGRTSKINIMDELPGKKKYGGWLDNY